MRLARHALAEQSLPGKRKPGQRAGREAKAARITPSQWALLSLVMERGRLSNKEISQTLAITSGAVTQLVDGLVAKRYLIRESSADDHRVLALKVSPKYTRRLNEMKEQALLRTMAIFTTFTDEEMAHYAKLSRKFTECILNLKTAG